MMDRKKIIELKYYETYYYANMIDNILDDTVYFAPLLEGFYCDKAFHAFFSPFPKYSVLHQLIGHIVYGEMHERYHEYRPAKQREEMGKIPLPSSLEESYKRTPLEEAFIHYELEHESFTDYLKDVGKSFKTADDNDVCDYYENILLCGPLDDLITRITSEVFQLLFINRRLLMDFNEYIAQMISSVIVEELPAEEKKYFKSDGVLKRCKNPVWVQNAVFCRDRGSCVFCKKDLTGQYKIGNKLNYDHIVPLANGGINDVSNIQLLCDECNSQKGHLSSSTNNIYESWY